MSGAAAPPRKRDKVRRLLDQFTHSPPSHANQKHHSSTLTTISNPIPSRPKLHSPSPTPSASVSYQSLPSGSTRDPALSTAQAGPPVQPTPTAPGTWGQDFWNRALQRLSWQEQATIRANILSTTNDIESALQQALNAAKVKQTTCQNKRWTFTFGGHTITLREEADKIVRWLDRFKQVGDVAVNVDPLHAGLPWAGIRFLLEVRAFSQCPLSHFHFLIDF
jgi:hypothetical protein